MFFLKKIPYKVNIHPRDFHTNIRKKIEEMTRFELEGTPSKRYGYIISVCQVDHLGKAKVLPGSGLAEFHLRCLVLLAKPYKGEVIDAIVDSVNKMGFFAEMGPLRVFVSSHNMPENKIFQEKNHPRYYSYNDKIIQKNVRVRIKLLGTGYNPSGIFAIGTIKDPELGVISF